jgi:hypothetical protein
LSVSLEVYLYVAVTDGLHVSYKFVTWALIGTKTRPLAIASQLEERLDDKARTGASTGPVALPAAATIT